MITLYNLLFQGVFKGTMEKLTTFCSNSVLKKSTLDEILG